MKMEDLEVRIVSFDIPSVPELPDEYRSGSVEVGIPRSGFPSIVDTDSGSKDFRRWIIDAVVLPYAQGKCSEDTIRLILEICIRIVSSDSRVLLDTFGDYEPDDSMPPFVTLTDEEKQELTDIGMTGDQLERFNALGITLKKHREYEETQRRRKEEIQQRRDAIARGENPLDFIDDSNVYTERPDRLTDATVDELIDLLKMKGVEFASGLTDDEVAAVESNFGFVFPLDLRRFLQRALSISDGFYNWRSDDESTLNALDAPLDGLLFDFQYNGFWLPEWGPGRRSSEEVESARAALRSRADPETGDLQPAEIDNDLPGATIIRNAVDKAPRLIPVLWNRYLPAEPSMPGNSVLSVHGYDTIFYGIDLLDYFGHEFKIPHFRRSGRSYRRTRFWNRVMATGLFNDQLSMGFGEDFEGFLRKP